MRDGIESMSANEKQGNTKRGQVVIAISKDRTKILKKMVEKRLLTAYSCNRD